MSDPAVDDLTKRLERLTTITEALQKQQQQQRKPFLKSCYMCGEETSHGVKDCPETVAFIASGILKLNTEGRVVRSNGGSLPRGALDGGGIAKILKEEIKRHKGSASNIEVDKTYLVANYEFAQLDEGDTEYTVMPAERGEKGVRKERAEPYDKSRLRSRDKGKGKAEPPKEGDRKPPKVEKPKAQVYVEVPPPPKVLRREDRSPQKEDVEMADQAPTAIRKITPPSAEQPAARFKPTPQGVRIKEDAAPNKPKRASPAYKFSSAVQESVDYDALVDKILDERISLSLREILSSYEVAKRMQSMTKSQKISITGSENTKSAKTAGAYVGEVTDDDEETNHVGRSVPEARVFNLQVDSSPSCIRQASIHSVEVASDEGKVRALSDEDYADTEDEAESYYRAIREEEYSMEKRRENNLVSAHSPRHSTKFLAMVTARISGIIGSGLTADMLIDNGSELNIMTMDLQEKLELPVDPSGATWVLKGVSGHTVQLVGLCRDVPIGIGGLEFNHNFFVAQGSIGDKQLILGQPWIYNHAARFDYIPPKGLQMQIWEHGDRDGNSVRITIPILNSPRNVFGTSATKERTGGWSSRVVELEATPGGPGLRLARPSLSAQRGEMPVVPATLSSIQDAYELPQGPTEKFGPPSTDIQFLSKYSQPDARTAEALKRSWILSGLSSNKSFTRHMLDIGSAQGYDDFEAEEFAHRMTTRIMNGTSSRRTSRITADVDYVADNLIREANGAKYKPVARKVLPVPAYDPGSVMPDYGAVELDMPPPLITRPTKKEDIKYTPRLSKERVERIIGNIPNGFLTKAEMDLFLHVVMDHENAFAFTDEERGSFSSAYYPDYVMRTVPHVPWQVHPIRLPKAREGEIMHMLDEQMRAGKYELSTSSYRSAFFAVEKKNNLLRIVHDLQPLNRVTIRDSSLPPRIDDMIEDFKGHAFYFIADLKAGYDAVILAKESRDLTAFHAYNFGLMRLTSLPQGYTNSMQEFCRRTSHMVSPIKDNVKVFVDDIAGKGPKSRYGEETLADNPDIRRFVYEGLTVLRNTLILVMRAGVTISGTKFVGATPELDILGATVSIYGAHIAHQALSKILKWPACQSASEVRGFLGTVGVVRRWIKDFAKVARPLVLMTTKEAAAQPFEWTEEAQKTMARLKESTKAAPPLASIDYVLASEIARSEQRETDMGLVTLAVDSSVIGAGWIISQTTQGGDLPVLFGSVTFKPHESRYSQPKLELYGLFRALKAERHRLYGIHFRVKVDARSLIEMINKPDLLPNAPGNRWMAFIQLFDFEVVHVKAERHKGPDGLSRRRRADDDSDDSDGSMNAEDENKFAKSTGRLVEANMLQTIMEEEESTYEADKRLIATRLSRVLGECLSLEVNWETDKALVPVGGNPLLFEGRVNVAENGDENADAEGDEMADEQPHRGHLADNDSEEFWDAILRYLLELKLPEGKDEAHRVKARAKSYFLKDNILWKRNGSKPPLHVVLEPSRRARLTADAHDNSGHRGRDPTFKKLQDSFWWPNMYNFVKAYCKTCHECQMRSSYRNKIPIEPTYVRTILREFAADTVYMPKGKGGYRYVIDLRDKFSGWVEAKMVRKATSANVADFIFEVMTRFGCLPKLTVDNGSEFKGAVMTLADKYKLPLIPISPYNPTANGMVERGHGVYIDSIWKVLQGNTSKWPDLIGSALWADRVTVKRTTGFSPYYLLYGQEPLHSFDITDRSWHALDWEKVKSTADLLGLRIKQLSRRDEYIGEASEKVRKERQKAADYFFERNKARMIENAYLPGMVVLVWNNSLEFQFGNKGALRWMGPYVVVQRRPTGSYVLAELDGAVMKKPVAAKRLKLYHYREIKEPIVRFEWVGRAEEEYDIVDENEEDLEYKDFNRTREVRAVDICRKRKGREGPSLPKPWELRGKEADEYWQKKMEDWKSGEIDKRRETGESPAWEKEIDDWNKDDAQFWNYNWDYEGYDSEDIPRWKSPPPDKPALFEWKRDGKWLPPGPPQYSSKATSVAKDDIEFIQLASPSLEAFCALPKNGNFNIVSHEGHTGRETHESHTGRKAGVADSFTMEHPDYGYISSRLLSMNCFTDSSNTPTSPFANLLQRSKAVIAESLDSSYAAMSATRPRASSDTSYSVNSLKTIRPRPPAGQTNSAAAPRGGNVSYSEGTRTPSRATPLPRSQHPASRSTTGSPDRDLEMEDVHDESTLDESCRLPHDFSVFPPTERNIRMVEKLTLAIKEAAESVKGAEEYGRRRRPQVHDAFDQAVSMIDYVRENLRDDARVADLHCSNVLAVCKQIRSDIKDTNESLRLLREGMTRQDGISAGKKQVARMLYVALTAALRHGAHQGDIGDRSFQRLIHHAGRISDAWINFEPDLESYEQDYEKELRKLIREYRREDIAIARDPVFDGNTQGLHQKERIPRRERRDEDELEEVEQSQANVRLDKGDSTPYVNRERGIRGSGPYLARGLSGHQAGVLPNGPRGYRGRGLFRGQLRGRPQAHLRDGRY